MVPIILAILVIFATGCGGGGEKPPPPVVPAKIAASSSHHSGAWAAYVSSNLIYGITPGRATPVRAFAHLWNSTLEGIDVQSNSIALPLRNISGTGVDPEHDIAAVFDYRDTRVVFIRYSTGAILSTFTTQDIFTAMPLTFGGAKGVYTSGIVLDASKQQLIVATSRGFLIVDYSEPSIPLLKKQIPSFERDANAGVEIMEHFALHPGLKNNSNTRRLIFTGGNYLRRTGDALVLIDVDSGEIFRPDAATRASLITDQYIDSVALDTQYHIALLSDEGAGLTWLDLNQLNLDAQQHLYNLPLQAIVRDINIVNFTQIAIAADTHMAFLASGVPAQSYFVAELSPPAQGLGFIRRSGIFKMPVVAYPDGRSAIWYGAGDPHGAIATHNEGTSRAWWANDKNTVIAIFDIATLLEHASQNNYDPFAGTAPAARYSILP